MPSFEAFRSVATLTLVTLVACNSSVVIEDGGGGSGAGEDGGNGAGGDINTGGAGAGGACGGFDDQDGIAPLTVRFRNDDFMPIYLPGTCSNAAFQLVPASGSEASYPYDPSCLQTCQDLQTEDQFVCGACAPIMYRLNPGESLEVTWDGTGLMNAQMPSACFHDPFAGPSCNRIVAAPADAYAVDALAYADCGENCECDDASGECYGYPTGLGAPPTPVTVVYPEANLVDVVWADCTFGCPL